MLRLAIVSPLYNEEEVLPISVVRMTELLDSLINKNKISLDSYWLIVNDGSSDKSRELLDGYFKTNRYIKVLHFIGNRGGQSAQIAGLQAVAGKMDAVITIDVDLQDDLDAIEKMIDRYNEGYEIVYGVKVSREVDPLWKRKTAEGFYKLQKSMGIDAVYNHSEFRLLSSRALRSLLEYKERNLYIRAIVPMLGYKSCYVDDVINERLAGKSKYDVWKLLRLSIDGITSFSTKPISLIFVIGFIFVLISIGIAFYVIYSIIIHANVAGWSSLMLSIWFVAGVLLMAISIIGQYIAKIYIEIKNRPLYHIDKLLWDKEEDKKETENIK